MTHILTFLSAAPFLLDLAVWYVTHQVKSMTCVTLNESRSKKNKQKNTLAYKSSFVSSGNFSVVNSLFVCVLFSLRFARQWVCGIKKTWKKRSSDSLSKSSRIMLGLWWDKPANIDGWIWAMNLRITSVVSQIAWKCKNTVLSEHQTSILFLFHFDMKLSDGRQHQHHSFFYSSAFTLTRESCTICVCVLVSFVS